MSLIKNASSDSKDRVKRKERRWKKKDSETTVIDVVQFDKNMTDLNPKVSAANFPICCLSTYILMLISQHTWFTE